MSNSHNDKVNMENLICSISEDDFFNDHMNDIVRETLEGE